jgi:hypothetical protein
LLLSRSEQEAEATDCASASSPEVKSLRSAREEEGEGDEAKTAHRTNAERRVQLMKTKQKKE